MITALALLKSPIGMALGSLIVFLIYRWMDKEKHK
jgi:uncharacterized membrane protein YdjX (TVP38/TMEM64 family)